MRARSEFTLSNIFLSSTTMLKSCSHFQHNCTMTNVSAIHRQEVRHHFKDATAQVEAVAKAVPNDKEDLFEEQMMWIEEFKRAVVSRKCGGCDSSSN